MVRIKAKKIVYKLRRSLKKDYKKTKKYFKQPIFGKRYLVFSLLVLLATTLLWSILSTKIQNANADQLVDPYLFQNSATFHGAIFPSAHSFLIKWPLFYLIHLFNASGVSLGFFTVLSVLTTVGALAYVMWRIDKRPLVFGTLCLALASVLLLIPAQPYAGGLLPVNIAMLATRNLEYVLYIAALVVLIKSPREKNRGFWLAAILLGILIASDKFFLIISLGGSVLALGFYSWKHRRPNATSSLDWFVASAIGGLIGFALLALIGNIVHISSQTGANPYGLTASPNNIALGVIYGILGLLTNFGANPAYDATVVRNIPHQLFSRIFGTSGPAYVINILILGFALLAIYRLVSLSLKTNDSWSKATRLASTLIWTSLVAIVAFIFTNHYYAVDARYLTICLFAGFISMAVYLSGQKKLRPEKIVIIGALICVGILFGLGGAVRSYNADQQALATLNSRDKLIAQALTNHPASLLVGDYWRVIPAKQAANNKIDVLPLGNCTEPRKTLTSTTWQADLKSKSFVYLLSYDVKLTDYPSCQYSQIVKAYGKPNSVVLIAGSLENPKEQLLYYDHGIHISPPKTSTSIAPITTNPTLPVPLNRLMSFRCQQPTIMNIVAHQDDDLLFMNPALTHDIQAGYCVRTVYITAGDDGQNQYYWLSRERGSEAAYLKMAGLQNTLWVERTIEINDHEFVTLARPEGLPRILLVFMHLPDGNQQGQGFESSHYESLLKLVAGRINIIHSIDGQSSYSSSDLTNALAALIDIYRPSEIRSQANDITSHASDHSDHIATGHYADTADSKYSPQLPIPLTYYMGYPVHDLAQNVFGQDLQAKEDTFLAYANFDNAVCHSINECMEHTTYGAYLIRQYQMPN